MRRAGKEKVGRPVAQGSLGALGPDGLPFAPDRSCLPTAPKGGLKPGPGPDRVRSSGANTRSRPRHPRPCLHGFRRTGFLRSTWPPSRGMLVRFPKVAFQRPVPEGADGGPDSWGGCRVPGRVMRLGGHHCALRMNLRPGCRRSDDPAPLRAGSRSMLSWCGCVRRFPLPGTFPSGRSCLPFGPCCSVAFWRPWCLHHVRAATEAMACAPDLQGADAAMITGQVSLSRVRGVPGVSTGSGSGNLFPSPDQGPEGPWSAPPLVPRHRSRDQIRARGRQVRPAPISGHEDRCAHLRGNSTKHGWRITVFGKRRFGWAPRFRLRMGPME